MVIQEKRITVAGFEQLAALPENRERRLEYIGGEVVEVVSNNYASQVAANILAEIRMHIKGKNLGDVTGADGGYIVGDERYVPDAAFISRQRQPEPCREAWNPLAPDLAVEVLSPTDDHKLLLVKVSNYLAAGTTVWVVYPNDKEVHVHRPGKGAQVFTSADTLSGDALLPDFTLPVKDIFEA